MHVQLGEGGLRSAARAVPLLLTCLASCVAGPERSAGSAPLGAAVRKRAPAEPKSAAEREAAEPQEQEKQEPPTKSGQEAPAEAAPGQEPPAAQAAEAERAKGSEAGASEASPSWVHGSLSVGYRGRFTNDAQDQDGRVLLTLDVADPGTPWISGHLLARMDVDLDDLDGDLIFQDLTDTYDGSIVTKLYLAYADVALDARPADSPGTLRIGRQSDPRLPEVLRLDGVAYQTRPMGERALELGVYGGIPVHLYESSREGDLAFGAFAEGEPWSGGRARVDWMHLEDELVLGDERDDLLALGLWQTVGRRWRMEGEFSHLEGDPRDLRLRAFFDDADSGTLVRAGYYELLETQTTRVTELDPFHEQLLDYFPFRQATLNASRAFGAHTVVDVGFDLRRVSDSGDVGEFNRDWERYYATATLHDLLSEGLALSVTGDRWDDDERDTSSFGADLSYAVERWNAAIGSYYSLYKYELLELDEREDVRTYYLRAERELSKSVELAFQYEFEDDDLDTYHTLRLGALWRF